MDLDAPRMPFEAGDDIVSILRALAARDHSRRALIDGDRVVLRGELITRVDAVARRLRGAGIGKGDRVALLGKNSVEYVEAFLGTLAVGACTVPLATMSTSEALGRMIEDSNAAGLFLGQDQVEAIRPALGGLGLRRLGVVGLDFVEDGVTPYSEWLAGPQAEARVVIEGTDEFDVMYSSGTTGVPKGIVHSHAVRKASYRGTRAVYFGEESVNAVATPLYSNTTCVTWLIATAVGAVSVLVSKWDTDGFLDLVERHGISHAMLVPVQHERLLRSPSLGSRNLSSLTHLFSTSAPLRAETKRGLLDHFPAEVVEIYGMTEGGVVTTLEARKHPDKLATVGKPAKGCEVKILNDAGEELPVGATGEIVGRSSSIMSGYLNRPDATQDIVWRDMDGRLFLRSGDIGRLDEEGFLHLLDRKKDVIISGGFNVYATDLEVVLLQHPSVREVAVIGIPSDRWGETPLALVVLEDAAKTSADEILQWCNGRVGKAQRLADVELRADLPKSAIGKVLKRELRMPYWDGQNRQGTPP